MVGGVICLLMHGWCESADSEPDVDVTLLAGPQPDKCCKGLALPWKGSVCQPAGR